MSIQKVKNLKPHQDGGVSQAINALIDAIEGMGVMVASEKLPEVGVESSDIDIATTIKDLQSRVANVSTLLSDQGDTVTDTMQTVSGITTDMATLSSAVAELTEKVTTLAAAVEGLKANACKCDQTTEEAPKKKSSYTPKKKGSK